jgi:hypothetical protein
MYVSVFEKEFLKSLAKKSDIPLWPNTGKNTLKILAFVKKI